MGMVITDYVDLECIVDASVNVAHDAGVISTVCYDEILHPQCPLCHYDWSHRSFWFFVVFQPRYVRCWISGAWTTQPQHVSGWLHDRAVHLVRLVKYRRARRCFLVVVACFSILVLVVVRIDF